MTASFVTFKGTPPSVDKKKPRQEKWQGTVDGNGGGGMRQIREGHERVNGLDTMRIRVERNTGSGSRFAGHVWATDQGVIARLAGEGESRGRRGRTLMNFRDVQIGLLDPRLFEAPRGVQIVQVKGGDVATLLEGMEAAGQIGLRR
jgi:hypothetical protein